MECIKAYPIGLNFGQTLVAVNGSGKKAVFSQARGDGTDTTNAKTAAAARKQPPTVAHNLLVARGAAKGEAKYEGHGLYPLTVTPGPDRAG
jgi:hypothetical protein